MHARRFPLLLAMVVMGFSRAVLAGPSGISDDTFDYHGWKIDVSHVPEPRNTAVAAITHQLDLVENVAMAQDIRTFMRSVPIAAESSRRDGGVAHYDRAHGIDVRYPDLDPKQPVILRELMHAYFDAHISPHPEGNADVLRYFQQAQASGKWPADADFLRDVGEFFSSAATVYVFGNMDRAPFTQGRLQAAQPEYWVWLGTVFDGFHGCE